MGKTKKQIKIELTKIQEYKWKFLRLNEGYIKDCEIWSGRSRKLWSKKEIILGYEYKGNLSGIKTGVFSKGLLVYAEKYNNEWCDLINSKGGVEAIRETGLNLIVSPHIGAWRSSWEKWNIELPLNPICDFVPFFVRIVPNQFISEPIFYAKFKNDRFLEKGTESLISVNWVMPIEYIKSQFEDILNFKRFILRQKGLIKDFRTRFEDFDDYIDVYKYRKEGWSLERLAKRFCKGNAENGRMSYAKRQITRFLKRCQYLIEGGYRQIG